jgi:membrane-bound ClpP family serine protease
MYAHCGYILLWSINPSFILPYHFTSHPPFSTAFNTHPLVSLIFCVILLISISLIYVLIFITSFQLIILELTCSSFSKSLRCIIRYIFAISLVFYTGSQKYKLSSQHCFLLYPKCSSRLCFHFY